jgi:endoglycosylceramidase
MKGRRFLLALAVIGAAGIVAGVVWGFQPPGRLVAVVRPAQRPAAADLPWLSVSGGRIVDAEGRTVLLRGFNDDALLHYPWRTPPAMDESDAALMARAGFDVVRLPISWDEIEPRRGVIDQAYVTRVVQTVAMLGRHHLYSILDMHFLPGWGEAFNSGTAPAWASLPLIPNVAWYPTDPADKDTNPAAMAAETYFWSSPAWQADFFRAWQAIARPLAGTSDLAGYDLYNEAHPFPVPPRLFEQWYLWPLYRRAIEAVGQADANHLFIVESTLFADEPTAIVPLTAPNLVYSPHLYTGALIPRILSGLGPNPIARSVAERRREAAMLPAALWFGELGIDHARADATQWAGDALQQLDDADSGWAWWQWRQDDGWGIRSESGDQLDLQFLSHLARPYVQAAPAGVTFQGADGLQGRLTIRLTAGVARQPIVVSWPALTLPPPTATAAGCTVQARYEQAVLTLVVDSSATDCTISLRPV